MIERWLEGKEDIRQKIVKLKIWKSLGRAEDTEKGSKIGMTIEEKTCKKDVLFFFCKFQKIICTVQ